MRVSLPVDLERLCIRGTKLFGLEFTGIDLKRDGNRYTFLEFNTSPMFAGFEIKSGFHIGEALAKHLEGA